MLEVRQKAPANYSGFVDDTIYLDHIQREKARLKVTSVKGEEVRLFLERGQILQRDEILVSACKRFIQVKLAGEPVITASTDSWQDFSRACYHLGNRHVRLQIGELWLRFLPDPVLLELVQHLGLSAEQHQAEFAPESGAYGHGHAGKAAHHADSH
ncbi:MAG: urease accessory protein UreE [Pseudomonadota bacterium]